MGTRGKRHGMSRRPETRRTFVIWAGMRARCRTAHESSYKYYGSRGVSVCDRRASFEKFVEDMGLAPDGMSIERLDISKGYEPANCMWATSAQQANNKSNSRMIEAFGLVMTVTEWGGLVGISPITIAGRLRYGWSVERALTQPVDKSKDWRGKP